MGLDLTVGDEHDMTLHERVDSCQHPVGYAIAGSVTRVQFPVVAIVAHCVVELGIVDAISHETVSELERIGLTGRNIQCKVIPAKSTGGGLSRKECQEPYEPTLDEEIGAGDSRIPSGTLCGAKRSARLGLSDIGRA